MTKLMELAAWDNDINMIGRGERVAGGRDGSVNIQAQKLSNRINYIRQALESISDYREYTFYPSEADPAGIVEGVAKTPNGKMFRVATGANGLGVFRYYRNENGTAIYYGDVDSSNSIIEKIDQRLGYIEHNLFDGTYQRLGLTDSGMVLNGPLLRAAIVRVKPSTKYIAMRRGNLSVFRIAESADAPQPGVAMTVTKSPTEKSSANTDLHSGLPQRWYEFTTKPDSNYVLIAVSDDGYEPELFFCPHAESKYLTADDFHRDIVSDSVTARGDIVGNNIKRGKNLANPSDYFRGAIPDALNETVNIVIGNDGYSAAVRIEPGETYTIAKDASDRFRVALSRQDPRDGDLAVRVIAAAESDNKELLTVTAGDQECFLTVYFASNAANLPTILQVELGEQFTGFETYGFNTAPAAINPHNPSIFGRVGIEIGKNIFDGTYALNATMTAPPAGLPNDAPLVANANARTAVIRIERATDYTISLPACDPASGRRFRVGVGVRVPRTNTTAEKITMLLSNDSATEFTFNSGNNNYLFIYAALNGPTPEFMQVEKGAAKTAWEYFGYKFSQAAVPVFSGGSANGNGPGVGNARYIVNKNGTWGAYADAAGTIPAMDDTEAVQTIFNNAQITGKAEFESNKYYLVSGNFEVNPSVVKCLNMNGATLVQMSNTATIHVLGTLAGSANPIQSGDKVHSEYGLFIDKPRICSVSRESGVGILLEKTIGVTLISPVLYFNSIGLQVKGMNRNINVVGGHIYANRNYGIHFMQSGDLHQMNITGTHISYSRINIFGDNQHLYNLQISGSDIEVSSYPDDVDKSIYLKALGDIKIDCIEITGNTLEGHSTDNALIRLEGAKIDSISNVVIAGNGIGNGGNAEIQIGGCRNVRIDNVHKFSNGHSVEFIGSTDNVNISGNFHKGKGDVLYCDGEHSLRNVKLFGTVIGGNVTKNPVYIRAALLENISVSMNEMRVNSLIDYSTDNAAIDIGLRPGGAGKLVRVDSNSLALPFGVNRAVKIDGAIIGKSASGNMNDRDASVIID
ncbi:hypothetical protein [Serratia marcescens]|uniref:hypothetical protein n=1 Tax=Serratia marcescens TaxID=615 RepID=UPI002178F7C0|nr:hypothetical protein [Serratia marcescens]CAI1756113.1 Uncharacterised protein [Serratia marcescens]